VSAESLVELRWDLLNWRRVVWQAVRKLHRNIHLYCHGNRRSYSGGFEFWHVPWLPSHRKLRLILLNSLSWFTIPIKKKSLTSATVLFLFKRCKTIHLSKSVAIRWCHLTGMKWLTTGYVDLIPGRYRFHTLLLRDRLWWRPSLLSSSGYRDPSVGARQSEPAADY
jgi:hypothetical protein